MAWTTPKTWTSGAWTVSDANTYIRDNTADLDTRVNAINAHTGTDVARNAVQSIANNSGTLISWDAKPFDSNSFGTTGTVPVTIPANFAGLYGITARVSWASSGTYTSGLVIIINAVQYAFLGLNNYANNAGSLVMRLAVADTLSMQVFQSSGGAINATATLSVNMIHS